MNNVLTLETLASKLSERASISHDQARDYIISIQSYITQQLVDGQSRVDVPHLGYFSLTASESNPITFTPIDNIAELVNEPFSFFEPEELVEESCEESPVKEEPAETVTPKAATPAEEATFQTSEPQPSHIELVEDEPNQMPTEPDGVPADLSLPTVQMEQEDGQPMEIGQTDVPAQTVQKDKPVGIIQEDELMETALYDEPVTESSREGLNPIVSYILGILTGMLLTCVAVYFLYPPIHGSDDSEYIDLDVEQFNTQEPVSTDLTDSQAITETTETVDLNSTVEAPVSEPDNTVKKDNETSDQPLGYETVGRHNYLATMSRKYYGKMEFWVYIYMENESKLGHPDRIPSGTVVTIPSKSKYGIDADDPQSVARAKRLSQEIQAKFK